MYNALKAHIYVPYNLQLPYIYICKIKSDFKRSFVSNIRSLNIDILIIHFINYNNHWYCRS